jgi:hypothetical protein
MISPMKELLLFEKYVDFSEKPDQWLLKVESSM